MPLPGIGIVLVLKELSTNAGTSCIPDLHGDDLVVDDDVFRKKVRTNGRLKRSSVRLWAICEDAESDV